MFSTSKLKSVDFYRKIPRDLTEASLSGAGLSIVAALSMMFLFGMNRLNITKTVRKYSIDSNMKSTGSEFHPGPIPNIVNHGDEDNVDEEYGEGSVSLTSENFDKFSHQYPILVVNFYAPWCFWSNRMVPCGILDKMEIIRRRFFWAGNKSNGYDPDVDGRIIMAKVDCTEQSELCRSHHIQGYPSVRIFRKGSDVRDNHGHHDHETYYGERDTESLVAAMETYVAPVPREHQKVALEDKSNETQVISKRPAPLTGGCRIEGFVRVKKVPGNLIISAHSGAHSFDPSLINVSHYISQFSFGRKLSVKMLSELKRITPYLGKSHDRLSGKTYIAKHGEADAKITIEHYLQVVKTEIMTLRSSVESKLFEEYEYTAHSSLLESTDIPIAKFHFEPAPMQVAGILDSILHNTFRMMKKIELGKNF
ncbi:Protein disulfide isomerase-like 5-4 [Acorus gramineus]|uniref:Protein disulfide isomerase-like 5-4 n=1 Tax=Acorus gramineus TaxID=55184 RepID=A0AAV9A7M4_ACOGR|nr:Protein disulfide isomerase-like 5-4 [Acorus gramineus]